MITERRKYLRVRERHKVRMTVRSLPDGVPSREMTIVGWTEDISAGGLRLTSRKELPVGADLKLHVECTHPQETYDILGRVMWCSRDSGATSARAGIYVQESPREAFLAWSRMIARRGE
jgi:Tfp pilus assembly protein PilZ